MIVRSCARRDRHPAAVAHALIDGAAGDRPARGRAENGFALTYRR
ncbi:hypothetical protein TOK_1918 [Pseudonocardia sp. N23]|nr:hypothetical protein TOK_1918 [Pseudonocardia sp. N23]